MIAIAAIEIGTIVMIIVAIIVVICRDRRRDPEIGDIMKPRCENCKHHEVSQATPNSPMVICTQEGISVHRWYKCESWEDESGQCLTCKYSKALNDDSDCVYVWCEKDTHAISKYTKADCWEKDGSDI